MKKLGPASSNIQLSDEQASSLFSCPGYHYMVRKLKSHYLGTPFDQANASLYYPFWFRGDFHVAISEAKAQYHH